MFDFYLHCNKKMCSANQLGKKGLDIFYLIQFYFNNPYMLLVAELPFVTIDFHEYSTSKGHLEVWSYLT